MRLKALFLGILLLTIGWNAIAQTKEYVVIAGKGITEDAAWKQVADALKNKHQAALVTYKENIDEVMPWLKKFRPRYVTVVEKPENLNRDYVIHLNRISRDVDDDAYADFLWGIITGYDADAAMKMVNNSTEPLVMKDAVATITEMHSGKWFDRYAWIDDHKEGLWGEKRSKNDSIITHHQPTVMQKLTIIDRAGNQKTIEVPGASSEETMGIFYDIYEKYNPDLVVTAAHATEFNLEMPFSRGNIKPKNGILYMDFDNNPQDLKESGKRKVYLPIGNCLIANVKNSKETMAIAWMNSGNAATMVGYVVPTWYGRNGWGGLKYLLTTPGRYSVAEAFYLNQQDMMYQLCEMSPKLPTFTYPYDAMTGDYDKIQMLADSLGIIKPNVDHLGFWHDRDVLAYYGDPKWNVRLQEIPEENDFTVKSQRKGRKCIVTITTKENFNLMRMKGDQFKKEHVLDLPFSYFFPKRLKNPRLSAGQNWKAAVDENFLLVYNADFKPGKTYTVELDVD